MSTLDDWLPPLICLADSHGKWADYLELLYDKFREDFIDSKPVIPGRRCGLKRHPMTNGKEATFWHFIQEGPAEDDRIPDIRRCERLSWVRAIIEAVPTDGRSIVQPSPTDRVIWWKNERKGGDRILLSLPDFSYRVVLDDRGDYILPWTAYPLTYEHQRRRARAEYEAYWRSING